MDLFAYVRKCLASVTLTAMLATFMAAPIAQAASSVEDFTDAAEIPTWADEAIEELLDMGVISGNDDGSFAPNRQLNRAEVSKIIVLAVGIDFDTTGGPHFPDVTEGDWFYDYVETMYNYGWINGYPDGLFRPGVGINRAELAKMVINAFEIDQDLSGAPHFDDVDESDWFYGYVETAYNYGLMRGYGDGSFGPGDAVTRAQTVKIVYDALLVISQPIGPAEGTLEVLLSPDTPRGTNIPFNATSVPFTTVEMTASDDSDVEVSSLVFTRLGLGDNDDFDNVWLEVDGFKVGNDKSVNNDDVVELRFNPPLIVPAGQTIVADVVASLEVGTASNDDDRANTGHHNRFALVSADDVVSTAANVVGDFPLEGEEMEIADYEVSQMRLTALGSDSTIDVGDNFIEIGKFRLLNDSNTNKDIELRAITFKNDGTAELEDTLENVALYVSGEQVSAETIIDGDYVTFRLDNGVTGGYIVEDGDSRIFSMRADIVSAEKDDTINFKVDNFEDIVGVEVGTSFGVKAVAGDSGLSLTTGASATTSSASCTSGTSAAEDDCARLRAYNIDAGDLNVSRDPSSLGNQEYAPGSNDVVFMTARVVVDQPMILDGVTVRVNENSAVADKSADSDTTASNLSDFNVAFDNFRLFINDKLVDSENDFKLKAGGVDGTVTDYELVFNTTFELAGTSIIKLVGNVEDDAATGDQVRVKLLAEDFESPEYISTGDQVESSQLLGSAEASFVEIRKSELTITRTDGLSDNDRIVAGVDDVTFLSFVLDNNDSGDVNTTSVTVDAVATGAAADCSNFTAALFVDGTQQGSAKNLQQTTCDATFNDISVVIPSAGQKEFTVVVDTIEESADANPASTTVSACTTSTTTAGATSAVFIATPGANAGVTTITTAAAHGLAVGDTVAIGVVVAGPTISLVAADTEVRTVLTVGSTTEITVSAATSQGHPNAGSVVGTDHGVVKVSTECDDDTVVNTITVADASNIAVGDTLELTGATATETATCTVSAVSGTSVTCTNLVDSGGAGDIDLPASVAETSASATFRMFVKAVDADNVENGQDVDVVVQRTNATATNGVGTNEAKLGTGETETGITTAIADSTTASAFDGNCDTATTANQDAFLCGVSFQLIQSGTLGVALESTVSSDVIVAGQSDVELIRVKFDAADDEIHVEDIWFINDLPTFDGTPDTGAEGRVDFKLYNAAGQLLQTKQMVNGIIHFELANQDRIRVPKDDVTHVVVKVDARAITDANQTGKRLNLRLGNFVADATNDPDVDANTAATGSDLADADISGSADGEDFVIYATTISVKHSATQPSVTIPSAAALTEAYRFTVSADAAGAVDLGRLTFNVILNGIDWGTGAANLMEVRPVENGVVKDDPVYNTTHAATTGSSAGDVIPVVADLTGERISAGGSKTYALFVNPTAEAGTAENSDGLTVEIVDDAQYENPAAKATVEGAAYCNAGSCNMIWSDESGSPHSATSADWLNGFEVDVDVTPKRLTK